MVFPIGQKPKISTCLKQNMPWNHRFRRNFMGFLSSLQLATSRYPNIGLPSHLHSRPWHGAPSDVFGIFLAPMFWHLKEGGIEFTLEYGAQTQTRTKCILPPINMEVKIRSLQMQLLSKYRAVSTCLPWLWVSKVLDGKIVLFQVVSTQGEWVDAPRSSNACWV